MGKVLIPDKFQDEFTAQTIRLFQARIRLFLILVIAFFIINIVLSYPYTPGVMNAWEIPFDIAVPLVSLAVYFLSGRTRRLLRLKVYAYLMNAILLVTGTVFYLIYPEIFYTGIASFLFLLLLIAMAMPWNKREILLVIATACLLFLGSGLLVRSPYFKDIFYLALNLFLMLFAGAVAMVFKHHDEARRRTEFLLRQELEEKKQAIERDLEIARQVHRSLIPKSFSNQLVDIAVLYLPLAYVGGDYAKFNFVSPHELLITIMDITGHGVPAALLVNRLHAEVSMLSRDIRRPSELLRKLESFVREIFEGTQMFLSAYACLLDFRRETLLYSNFGHPPQVLYHTKKSEILYMTPQRQWVGVESLKTAQIQEAELSFEKGDRILLFTDGLLDARDRDGKFFGKEGLETFLRLHHRLESDRFNQELVSELNRFGAGTAFADDIFILNIQTKR